ncbi:MAG: hypothetical protein PWP04_1028 [Candidatus Atribacteria bacterium]|nr:hypothetical protein [Candidatus Atribacteria bacterium]
MRENIFAGITLTLTLSRQGRGKKKKSRGKGKNMWSSPEEGEGKSSEITNGKRVYRGEFFPPYAEEDAFPSSMGFCFFLLCLFGFLGL